MNFPNFRISVDKWMPYEEYLRFHLHNNHCFNKWILRNKNEILYLFKCIEQNKIALISNEIFSGK